MSCHRRHVSSYNTTIIPGPFEVTKHACRTLYIYKRNYYLKYYCDTNNNTFGCNFIIKNCRRPLNSRRKNNINNPNSVVIYEMDTAAEHHFTVPSVVNVKYKIIIRRFNNTHLDTNNTSIVYLYKVVLSSSLKHDNLHLKYK